MKYNFVEIKNLKYSKLIYKINNDYTVRKFSSKPKRFTYKIHLLWMKNILKNKIESIFLVKIKKKTLGIVRKKKIKKRYYLSWVINKKFKNRGHGKNMLKQFVSRRKRKYIAKIHNSNVASIKIATLAGFKKQKHSKNFSTFICN